MDKKPLLGACNSDGEDNVTIDSTRFLSPYSSSLKRKFNTTFKELSTIVKTGDMKKLKEVLKDRDIQLTDFKGLTILHVAAASNNVKVLGLLLRHKRCWALLDRQDQTGVTPLMSALYSNSLKTLELLCSRGADPTKTLIKTDETIIHLASARMDPRAAEILIKYYSSPELINYKDFSGDIALTESVRVRSPTFDILMAAGADVTSQNPENGRTILHVAVAYNRQSMLKKILKHPDVSKEFADIQDIRGETALMIAVKLQRLEIIKILTTAFTNLNGINLMEHESVLHVAVEGNRPDILQRLLNFTSVSSINYVNSENKTPILYAAELDYAACLIELIEFGADFHLTNNNTGESVLHVVAKHHSNSTLPFLMNLPHITWFFVQKDYNGNTPYMTAIMSGNDLFLHEVFKEKTVDLLEYNSEGETPTYYAIKHGFPKVLFTLLLSPNYYEFAKRTQITLDQNDPIIIRKAEIRGDIFASDVYILLKEVIQYPLVSWLPPSLLKKMIDGRSVFHACALGGNLECLEFLYEFFRLFAPEQCRSVFDEPCKLGDTPLLYAAQCGNVPVPCVHFFVTHGADLAATNNDGLDVIQAIYMNNPDASTLFTSIFNTCVTAKKDHYYSDKLNIKLDFKVLCPGKYDQTKVVLALFKKTKGYEGRTTLQHPVIVTFLKLKLYRIKDILLYRLILSFVVTIVISVALPIMYVIENREEKGYDKYIILLLLITTITMSMFQAMLKVGPIMRKDLWFTDTIAFIPPIAMIILAVGGKSLYFAQELVATTILSCWICVLVFMINLYSKFSYQIAVFFRLLHSISQQLLVLTVLIFTFSLSFFCVYNEDKRFSHFPSSFIYTFTVMLPGFISDVPTFKAINFAKTPDILHFIIECIVLLVFIVVAMTSFVNMIVGLAVRGGQFLEADGEVFQRHHEIHYLSAIEYCFENKFYNWLERKCKFIANIKRKMFIDTIINIYDEKHKEVCDKNLIRQFRSIVFERKLQDTSFTSSNREGEDVSANLEDVLHDPFGYLPGANL